ncbi:MAG: hypothetical protein K6G15_03030 [Desulfovibrio sp.]|nr:hypothetical protein [Desulfovibrio sp.]
MSHNTLSYKTASREAYERGFKKGFDEGKHNSKRITKIEFALLFLENGLPIERIPKAIDLTPEKLFELQEQVRQKSLKKKKNKELEHLCWSVPMLKPASTRQNVVRSSV